MKGLRIRVAGPGVYQDIVRSLGAAPVVFPAIEMGAALARGAMDGIITSPGGWGKNVQDAPSASLVPGLLFYTYLDCRQSVVRRAAGGGAKNARRSRAS